MDKKLYYKKFKLRYSSLNEVPVISYLIIYLILPINFALSENLNKTYFAGGCFWCMEESFEKLNGVKEVISGYSGGTTSDPTYKEVTFGNTGHFEVVEVIYDKNIISFKELLKNFWINIDPFDAFGQFCDKGYSYRSVAFYQNEYEKKPLKKVLLILKINLIRELLHTLENLKFFIKLRINIRIIIRNIYLIT